MTGQRDGQQQTQSTKWTGFVLGVALMGSLDEIIFHQLLQWHNFYQHANEYWRIFSDGVFHSLTTALWLLAAVLLWRQRHGLARMAGSRLLWAGVLLGMGSFQTFDGVVNHKVLQLHPVREQVATWVYDAAWVASGLLLLVLGCFLRRRH